MTKLDTIKGKVGEAEDFARKIWLAGLGAYGKSYDEVQNRYDKISTDTQKVFHELVAKGEKIESQAKTKIKEQTNVEARVEEVRRKLGLDDPTTEDKVEELSAKIDALTEAVEKLAAR
ncbi:phasin family protein [Aestuariibacter sp. AA17]|uniref:Phasin family protein n=1 Tax=Fluctibacter corallii TaxID=2984329 RepID=A0ABT3A924_9ALTE|nr:phasin family protein [Aestuariibacter sp. AA17]MCV2885110.1 phasin family protein [Aestuariibacter sp. AA17]